MFKTLIVEDNSQICLELRRTLGQRFPFMTLVDVADGAEARVRIDRWRPHLVTMDVCIPHGNGLELTRHVKKSQPETTVIIFTGHDLPEYRQEAGRCGADYFLAKHAVSSSELASVVECVLTGRFKALIFAENEALREQLSVFLSVKWPAMVVVDVREQEEAIQIARALKPDLVVLDLAQDDHEPENLLDRMQTDRARNGVVVSIRDPVNDTPCPTDYCVAKGDAAGNDIANIINSVLFGIRQCR